MRRRLVVLLAAVLLAACSGGGGKAVVRRSLASTDVASDTTGSTDSGATTASSSPTQGPLPSVACTAFAHYREVRRQAAVVDLSSLTGDQLQAQYDAGRSALQAVIDALDDGTLKTDLGQQRDLQRASQADVAAAWGDTGAALAEKARAAGYHSIGAYVSRSGISTGAGATVTLNELVRLIERNLGRLTVGCVDSLLGDRPDVRTPAPPSGTIVFSSAPDGGSGLTLASAPSTGGEATELLTPGSSSRIEAAVGSDGAVAFESVGANGVGTLLIARDLGHLGSAVAAPIDGDCPAWAPDRRLLVASATTTVADARLASLGPDGQVGTVTLPFPAADLGCAAFAGPDALVVSRTVFGGGVELWNVPLSGSDATKVYERRDCGGTVGAVAADGSVAAVYLRCADVSDDGVHLVDLTTGTAQHAVTAMVLTPPRLSPDGEWLVFAACPLGCDTATDMRVTVARRDGSASRPVVAGLGTWPTWIPSSAEGGTSDL